MPIGVTKKINKKNKEPGGFAPRSIGKTQTRKILRKTNTEIDYAEVFGKPGPKTITIKETEMPNAPPKRGIPSRKPSGIGFLAFPSKSFRTAVIGRVQRKTGGRRNFLCESSAIKEA